MRPRVCVTRVQSSHHQKQRTPQQNRQVVVVERVGVHSHNLSTRIEGNTREREPTQSVGRETVCLKRRKEELP